MEIISVAVPSQVRAPKAFPAVPRLAGTDAPELGALGT